MKWSAALLLYREAPGGSESAELLLVHPGGPFWVNKDEHAWSIPKGEFDAGDDGEAAALREFAEELGQPPPDCERIFLGDFKQNSSKTISVWIGRGDLDVSVVDSNEFEMEWPPRSGVMQSFPEVDRAEWFDVEEARQKMHKGQTPVLDAFLQFLSGRPTTKP
jgi:predicted NUDIX family NTP pyrophosphohydrolase